jgi:hypothetical protein
MATLTCLCWDPRHNSNSSLPDKFSFANLVELQVRCVSPAAILKIASSISSSKVRILGICESELTDVSTTKSLFASLETSNVKYLNLANLPETICHEHISFKDTLKVYRRLDHDAYVLLGEVSRFYTRMEFDGYCLTTLLSINFSKKC